MLTFDRIIALIETKKLSVAQLRNMLAIVNRKPQFFDATNEAIRDFNPRLNNHDFSVAVKILKSHMMGYRPDVLRANVNEEHKEQLTMIDKIFINHIQVNSIGIYPIHTAVFTIVHSDNQIGFSYYLSGGKPIIL